MIVIMQLLYFVISKSLPSSLERSQQLFALTTSKIGDPGFPVAAVECGHRVIVHAGVSFEVGDHDFTTLSMVPSVALINNIPSDLADSWYCGQVTVTLKEGAFEPSSLLRHAMELKQKLWRQNAAIKPVICLYTDRENTVERVMSTPNVGLQSVD